MSEKLDGFRAFWNGKEFRSRNDNVFECPDWFIKGFPSEPLDGELWAGRGGIEKVNSAIRGGRERDWQNMLFGVFDTPRDKLLYEDRCDLALKITRDANKAFVIPKWKCEGRQHLLSELDRIVDLGGEGIVLRRPRSKYEPFRSDVMVKVKKTIEDDAVVLAHVEVSRPGLMGKLRVIRKDGLIFDVGSGISEKMAANPPPVGTRIVYSYKQVTAKGKPRSASFVRVRSDLEG